MNSVSICELLYLYQLIIDDYHLLSKFDSSQQNNDDSEIVEMKLAVEFVMQCDVDKDV